MIIEIDALDTLFFRDGKPFTMGEDVWANGMFPPNPSVIYGALRSRYFSENISELDKANNNDDPTKNLVIKGIYLKRDEDFLFPYPLDCVLNKESNEISRLKMKKNNMISSFSMSNILLNESSNAKVESLNNNLIDDLSLSDYLEGSSAGFSKIDSIFNIEPKIGIGRDRLTGTSEDGKLYRVGLIRLLEDIKIIVEFENLTIDKIGILKLGGEGKGANYKSIVTGFEYNEKLDISEGTFCLYLLTPALLKKGWIPSFIDEETKNGTVVGCEIKLLTGAIGKFVNIGGFDMKNNKPKVMLKAVPAGSVYYFKFKGDFNKIQEELNLKSISDYRENEGFGISIIGRV